MNWDEITENAREILNLRPDGWDKSFEWDVAKLLEECGEVAEAVVKSKKTKEDLGEEISDAINVLATIALRHGIDFPEAQRLKHAKRVQKLLNRFHNGEYPEPKIELGGTHD